MKKMMKMSSASSAVLSPQCLAHPPNKSRIVITGHFRLVPKTLAFKMRLGAQLFLVKISFIHDFHIQG